MRWSPHLVSGYEPLIEGLKLPDPGDRHVLAAAIKSGAQVIVTRNLKHFPASDLEPWDIEAKSPDRGLPDKPARVRGRCSEPIGTRWTRGIRRSPPCGLAVTEHARTIRPRGRPARPTTGIIAPGRARQQRRPAVVVHRDFQPQRSP